MLLHLLASVIFASDPVSQIERMRLIESDLAILTADERNLQSAAKTGVCKAVVDAAPVGFFPLCAFSIRLANSPIMTDVADIMETPPSFAREVTRPMTAKEMAHLTRRVRALALNSQVQCFAGTPENCIARLSKKYFVTTMGEPSISSKKGGSADGHFSVLAFEPPALDAIRAENLQLNSGMSFGILYERNVVSLVSVEAVLVDELAIARFMDAFIMIDENCRDLERAGIDKLISNAFDRKAFSISVFKLSTYKIWTGKLNCGLNYSFQFVENKQDWPTAKLSIIGNPARH